MEMAGRHDVSSPSDYTCGNSPAVSSRDSLSFNSFIYNIDPSASVYQSNVFDSASASACQSDGIDVASASASQSDDRVVPEHQDDENVDDTLAPVNQDNGVHYVTDADGSHAVETSGRSERTRELSHSPGRRSRHRQDDAVSDKTPERRDRSRLFSGSRNFRIGARTVSTIKKRNIGCGSRPPSDRQKENSSHIPSLTGYVVDDPDDCSRSDERHAKLIETLSVTSMAKDK